MRTFPYRGRGIDGTSRKLGIIHKMPQRRAAVDDYRIICKLDECQVDTSCGKISLLGDGPARPPTKVVPSYEISRGKRMVASDPGVTEWDFLSFGLIQKDFFDFFLDRERGELKHLSTRRKRNQ